MSAKHTPHGLLLKVLNEDGTPCHGGSGAWPLPIADGPGAWREVAGMLEPCLNGLHLTDLPRFRLQWMGPAVWLAEYDGEHIDDNYKTVVRRARLIRRLAWDERAARLFACECADRVLPLFERAYPGDDRPRRCLEVARRFAVGEATEATLRDAWEIATAAAWRPGGDAVWNTTWKSAWDGASAAAVNAAWAAGVAERRWQLARLAAVLGLTDDERAAVWPQEGAA